MQPQIDWFVKKKITPNTISIAGFIIMSISAVMYALPQYFLYNFWTAWIPPFLFFFSGYLDLMDGSVARASGMASKFGGFFDSTLDRIGDAVIFLGLMLGNMLYPWDQTINNILGYLALSICIMISYTRSRAELEGVHMMGIGFMERGERVFFIMGGYIIEGLISNWSEMFTLWGIYDVNPYPTGAKWFFPVFFIIFILLSLQTLIARIKHTYKWLTGTMSAKYLEKHNLVEKYQAMQDELLKSKENKQTEDASENKDNTNNQIIKKKTE